MSVKVIRCGTLMEQQQTASVTACDYGKRFDDDIVEMEYQIPHVSSIFSQRLLQLHTWQSVLDYVLQHWLQTNCIPSLSHLHVIFQCRVGVDHASGRVKNELHGRLCVCQCPFMYVDSPVVGVDGCKVLLLTCIKAITVHFDWTNQSSVATMAGKLSFLEIDACFLTSAYIIHWDPIQYDILCESARKCMLGDDTKWIDTLLSGVGIYNDIDWFVIVTTLVTENRHCFPKLPPYAIVYTIIRLMGQNTPHWDNTCEKVYERIRDFHLAAVYILTGTPKHVTIWKSVLHSLSPVVIETLDNIKSMPSETTVLVVDDMSTAVQISDSQLCHSLCFCKTSAPEILPVHAIDLCVCEYRCVWIPTCRH